MKDLDVALKLIKELQTVANSAIDQLSERSLRNAFGINGNKVRMQAKDLNDRVSVFFSAIARKREEAEFRWKAAGWMAQREAEARRELREVGAAREEQIVAKEVENERKRMLELQFGKAPINRDEFEKLQASVVGLRNTLGTLVSWLRGVLGDSQAEQLQVLIDKTIHEDVE